MKRFLCISIILGAVAILFFGFANTWDYGFNCTRCLYHEVHIKYRLCGFTLWESTSGGPYQYERTYLQLFQKPCSHAMKAGGFGHNPGCGMTAEGIVFTGRNNAVRALFDAYQRNPNLSLALESFALVEQLFPEQTTVESYYRMQQQLQTNAPNCADMVMYADMINVVETNDEWQRVNAVARSNITSMPAFLRDKDLMRAKLNSPSYLVRGSARSWLDYPFKP